MRRSLVDEVNGALYDQITKEEEEPKPDKETYLKNLDTTNKRALDNAKEVYSAYSENSKAAHDDMIRLHKSIAQFENPYKSLEIALKVIQDFTNDKTFLEQFHSNVEIVRARALEDENAKMYARENLDTLIDRVKVSVRFDSEEEFERALYELKQKRESLD